MKSTIKGYQDLQVWKRARFFFKQIHILTRAFPKEELFCLTQQMRRSALSIPSNLAEGHLRHGTKDYIHFVSIAIGSAAELETQLLLAFDLEYVTKTAFAPYLDEIDQIQKMLHGLRQSLKSKL